MKKNIILTLFILLSFHLFSQRNEYFDFSERGEAYFSFNTDDEDIILQIAKVLSIDKIEEDGKIIAYANEKEFNKFLQFGLEPTILTPPSMLEEHKMFTLDDYYSKAVNNWDSYPTYENYISMMNDFETNFPNLCETIEFGTTVNNRKLMICKLTSNLNPNKKAKIHLSSTMHGDETTGYVLMLRLIDYLLNNYATDARIKNILDNAEVWICPNANPDGTYKTGNDNVYGATRSNGNNVDLNRNYKDDVYGNHPDGNAWQIETLAFMALQEDIKFHLSVNIHGGVEVCNYPWDNKYSTSADDSWWEYVCREYADTTHVYAPSGYMTYKNNGVTRGALWYSIGGGRQDYANYYDHCREFCLEISNDKMPNMNSLPNYWNWNYRSFLNYIEQALYGIHGTITEAGTGNPLYCSVEIQGHDHTESHVYSNPETGYYARPIKAGTYTVKYTTDGYDPEIRTVTIADRQKIILDIVFGETAVLTPDFIANTTEIEIGETINFIDESYSTNPITQYSWTFEGGTPATSNEENPIITYFEAGNFDVALTITDGTITETLSKENYITVTAPSMPAPIAEFSANNTFIETNSIVEFYDRSENNPTSWLWFFEGGTPATSDEQNPIITYLEAGTFDVTLTVANDYGKNVNTKTDYITVALSIDEFDSTIRIYPNPAKETINIQSETLIEQIELLDMTGKTIFNQNIRDNHAAIKINNIQSGLYIINIQLENSKYSSKIIISD